MRWFLENGKYLIIVTIMRKTKKPKIITTEIYQSINNKTTLLGRKARICVDKNDEKRAVMINDGRPLFLIEGKWTYVAR